MQKMKHFHRYAGRLLIAGMPLSLLSNVIAREATSPESGLDSEFGQLVVVPSLILLAAILGIVSIACYVLGILGYIIRLWREKKATDEELPGQSES